MQCPKCQSSSKVKNGVVKSQQRYKCKDCGCSYTISFAGMLEKEKKRRFALSLYLGGSSFHTIGRLLGVSHVSVLNWIRHYEGRLKTVRNPRPAKVIELDEMHNYMGHKKVANDFGLTLMDKYESPLIPLLETEVQKQA
jgi:transposase-like protein